MGFFELFTGHNTLDDVVECKSNGGVVLDVRSRGEFNGGHIPGSINVPVGDIDELAAKHIKGKHTPVCVYCQSGARSAAAAKKLEHMGYTNVKNIGALRQYKGKIER